MKKTITFLFINLLLFSIYHFTLLDKESLNELINKAEQLEKNAANKNDVENVIVAYQNVLFLDSANYQALCKIGNYKLLMGAGFATSSKEKRKFYEESFLYLEKAMATNAMFLEGIKNKKTVSEASKMLGKKEIDAMGYWYTAKFYYFKECLGVFGKIKNRPLLEENNKMIELVRSIDSTWSGGGVYFSKAIYNIATPEKYGGSKKEAKKQFDIALAIDSSFICTRWGRAKYLYSITGEKEEFVKDLNWVIKQDLSSINKSPVPNAWNVYFQNDAKKMLKAVK